VFELVDKMVMMVFVFKLGQLKTEVDELASVTS